MKNLILTTVLLLAFWVGSVNVSNAQISTAKNAISYKLVAMDYRTLLEKNFFEKENYGLGAEIAYSRYLNKSLNLNIPARLGRADYPTSDNTFAAKRIHVGLDLAVVYKLNNGYILGEKAVIAPYLLAGIGANYNDFLDNGIDMQIPLGGGINWKIAPNVYLQTQAEYRLSVLEDYNNMTFSGGMIFFLGEGDGDEKIVPLPVEEPKDSDGDGVTDNIDDCPNIPGLAALKGCPDGDKDGIADKDDKCPKIFGVKDFDGCPDTDGDGIADKDDKCPKVAGPLSNQGCPEAKDADGDGVNDDQDDCPQTPGLAAFQGCPDADGDGVKDSQDACPNTPGLVALRGCPDSDGDGVIDKDDRCPSKVGPASNKGCPEIKEEVKEKLKFAMRAVQFETGSATIKTSSYTVLDEIAQIMAQHGAYSLSINGHTDNVGNDANNQLLSERRAKASYDYLVKKGVSPSRIFHSGYGETQPIADNTTKEGRSLNRRVEFNIFLR